MKDFDTEKFLKILADLSDYMVIVEGKNDEKALKRLGQRNIIAINRRPLYRVAGIADSKNNEVVILTDFDDKGKELNSKLSSFIKNVKINSGLRKRFGSLGIYRIEDLKNLVDIMDSFKEDDYHVKIGTNFNKVRNKSIDKCKRNDRET